MGIGMKLLLLREDSNWRTDPRLEGLVFGETSCRQNNRLPVKVWAAPRSWKNVISDGWVTWERISQKLIFWRHVLRGSLGVMGMLGLFVPFPRVQMLKEELYKEGTLFKCLILLALEH